MLSRGGRKGARMRGRWRRASGYRGRKGHLTSNPLWIWAFGGEKRGEALLPGSILVHFPLQSLNTGSWVPSSATFCLPFLFFITTSTSPPLLAALTRSGVWALLQNNLEVEEFYRSIPRETIFSASRSWRIRVCGAILRAHVFQVRTSLKILSEVAPQRG